MVKRVHQWTRSVARPQPRSRATPSDPSLMDHLSGGNFAGFKAKMQEHASSAAARGRERPARGAVAPAVAVASESAGAWHDENIGGPLAAAAASASAAVAGASLFGAAPDPEGGELRGSR